MHSKAFTLGVTITKLNLPTLKLRQACAASAADPQRTQRLNRKVNYQHIILSFTTI